MAGPDLVSSNIGENTAAGNAVQDFGEAIGRKSVPLARKASLFVKSGGQSFYQAGRSATGIFRSKNNAAGNYLNRTGSNLVDTAAQGVTGYTRSLSAAMPNEPGVVRSGIGDTSQNQNIPEKPPIPASVEEAEQIIRNQAYETIYVFDRNGQLIDAQNGSVGKASVRVDHALVQDAVCIHNHPSGSTFSQYDVLFIRDMNPSDFRVVTSTKRFRIVRKGTAWPDEMVPEYKKHFATMHGRYQKDLIKGKIKQDEFNKRVFRDALRRTVEALNLFYTEEEL